MLNRINSTDLTTSSIRVEGDNAFNSLESFFSLSGDKQIKVHNIDDPQAFSIEADKTARSVSDMQELADFGKVVGMALAFPITGPLYLYHRANRNRVVTEIKDQNMPDLLLIKEQAAKILEIKEVVKERIFEEKDPAVKRDLKALYKTIKAKEQEAHAAVNMCRTEIQSLKESFPQAFNEEGSLIDIRIYQKGCSLNAVNFNLRSDVADIRIKYGEIISNPLNNLYQDM